MKTKKNVKVALLEPDSDLRTVIRGTLRDIGFARVRDTERSVVIHDKIKNGAVDLLISDVTNHESEICAVVRQMRNRTLGENPFPITIGLTHDPDQEHVAHAVNAGFDCVILKPMDLNLLRRRMVYFTRTRKPFVVTATYVGPDRRKEPRTGSFDKNTMIVPNPVKMVTDGMTRDTMRAHVREACTELDEQKVVRDVLSIRWLLGEIDRGMSKSGTSNNVSELVTQFVEQTSNVDDRIHRTVFSDASGLTNSLRLASENLRVMSQSPRREDIDRLMNISDSLIAATNADPESRFNAGRHKPARAI